MINEATLKFSTRARPLQAEPGLKLRGDALGAARLYAAGAACDRDVRDARCIGYTPSCSPLSRRQLAVAQLVALGLADKEIAMFLQVSQGTVKGNISLILRKLSLRRRTQICRYIHEMDLYPGD